MSWELWVLAVLGLPVWVVAVYGIVDLYIMICKALYNDTRRLFRR